MIWITFERWLQPVLVSLACLTLLSCSFPRESHSNINLVGTPASAGPHAVNILQFPSLIDEVRNRSIPIKIHLPESDGPYPLIIVSHGAGGSWDANYAQAHHLATHGYIVFALEHTGSNTARAKQSLRYFANIKAMTRDSAEVLGRPKDVSFAIDRAEYWNTTHPILRGRIDLEHIGVLGHSFGAYTTMVVTGVRPALDWLNPTVEPGHGLGPDLSDKRVDCGVALSPQGPGEPFFIEESYNSLHTPLLGISGSRDKQQKAEPENRRRAFELWPPGGKYFIWLESADHSAFSDSTGAGTRMLPSLSRADAQPIVRAASLAFFDIYLKGDTEAKNRLTYEQLGRYLNGEIDQIEVLRK